MVSLGRHTNDTNDVTPCHNKISDIAFLSRYCVAFNNYSAGI